MDSHAAMKLCLEEMDVQGIRSLWQLIAPGMPQPKNDFDTMVQIHMARAQMPSLTARQRYYSHRWLLDHNMLSPLPDHEKPSAERMYPQTKSGVGISLNGRSELSRAAIPQIRTAMEHAVLDAYAEGRRDDIPFVKSRMAEARTTVMRKLLGRIEPNG